MSCDMTEDSSISRVGSKFSNYNSVFVRVQRKKGNVLLLLSSFLVLALIASVRETKTFPS